MRIQHMNRLGLMGVMTLLPLAAVAAPDMSGGVRVPAGPTGVMPAGVKAPDISAAADDGAPAIAAISDVTFPDETLVVTGVGLDGARLRLWAEGKTAEVEPLRSRDNRLQAVVPKDFPLATTLVWPVKDGRTGAPIRVNGPAAWWSWPPRLKTGVAGQTVRLFGKCLSLPGATAKVYAVGPDFEGEFEIVKGDRWSLEAALPGAPKTGEWRVWIHNGTGGSVGWSEPLVFESTEVPDPSRLETIRVDRFGARPDDAGDDTDAIVAAIEAAKAAGGAVVEFSPGRYVVSRTLVLDGEGPQGIHLEGAGMGEHDWATRNPPEPQRVIHQVSGTHTMLAPPDDATPPERMLEIRRAHSSVRDLTIATRAGGPDIRNTFLLAPDVTLERTRLIVDDTRPIFTGWGKPEKEVTGTDINSLLIDNGALFVDAPGKSNIVIRGCEFHSPGSGIEIGGHERIFGTRSTDIPCPPKTDYMLIQGCKFRGYWDVRVVPDFKESGRVTHRPGWFNYGISNSSSSHCIIEENDFAGADKNGFKTLIRCVNYRNTSVRMNYVARNTGRELGTTDVGIGRNISRNRGELILFHLWYPQGGLFDVVGAGPDSVTIDPSDPRYGAHGKRRSHSRVNGVMYSEVPVDLDTHPDHWVVFVCAGRGVGQMRVLQACERGEPKVTLRTAKPWRVTPDETSRIMLNACYRNHLVIGNEFESTPLAMTHKSHGVCFWANSSENVVAENEFTSLSAGVSFNTFYRSPTAWNLTRDNEMRHIYGYGGDTSYPMPGMYVDHCRAQQPPPEHRVWMSAGNVARSNVGFDGVSAIHFHNLVSESHLARGVYDYPDAEDGGHMLSVVENSRFEQVDHGLLISSPANWSLVRNTVIAPKDKDTPLVRDQSKGIEGSSGAYELLLIDVTRD